MRSAPRGCWSSCLLVTFPSTTQFERLLVHLDVDVLSYVDMPLAENTRRNVGLRFDQLVAALRPLLAAPDWVALTVTEVNPDHGEDDGSTLRIFAEALAEAMASKRNEI